jgi:hypothetical protein
VSLKYEPKKIIKRLKLKEAAEKLVTADLNLNRTVVKTIANAGVLPKKVAENVAIKVLKEYKKKYKAEKKTGATNTDAKAEAINGKKQMNARVQSAVLNFQTEVIRKAYRGEFYRWLPSSANEPDPEHMKNYGEIFQLGKGESPGQRYGCQCGMEILTDDTPAEQREKLEGVI